MGASLLKFMVSGYKGAKDFEGTLDAAMQSLMANAAQQQQQAQSQPPQPSPEQIKAQIAQQKIAADAQSEEAKNQTAIQVAQLQAQVKQQELQLRAYEAQTHAKQVDAEIERDQTATHIAIVDGAHQQAMDRVTPLTPGGL